MRKKVGDALLQLGITPDLKGFNYIIDMVEMIDKGELSKVTAGYAIIAKKYGNTASGIERGIRHAITKIDTKSREYERYIGGNVESQKTDYVTNSVFLYTLHYRLKEG